MNRTIKTYGVYGLMDWQPLLNAGKAKFQPLFSGGGVTAYGETPAKYTTSNPVCQHLIERSHYFQTGYIKLLYKHGSANDVRDSLEECSEEKTLPDEQLKEMKFSSLGDASAYLNETFGIIKSKMRTREEIIELGKENGIDVKFTD